jgi:hypothetical protein
MEFHSSLTIHSQEFTVFLGYQNHQLMADLCDWFDCRKRWTYRTKGQGTDEIINVWVNIIGATTPDLIQSALPMDAIGGGLTSRMIFVHEMKKGKTVITPFYTNEDFDLKQKMLIDLEKIKMLQGKFTVTEEFMELWTEWYPYQDDHPPFDSSRFEGYFERRPMHVMKLSLILNASRCSDLVISGKDLEQAISLLEKTEINMPSTFSGVGRAPNADVMGKIMTMIGNRKKMKISELLFSFRGDIDKRGLYQIIETMEAMQFVNVLHPSEELEYTGDQLPL